MHNPIARHARAAARRVGGWLTGLGAPAEPIDPRYIESLPHLRERVRQRAIEYIGAVEEAVKANLDLTPSPVPWGPPVEVDDEPGTLGEVAPSRPPPGPVRQSQYIAPADGGLWLSRKRTVDDGRGVVYRLRRGPERQVVLRSVDGAHTELHFGSEWCPDRSDWRYLGHALDLVQPPLLVGSFLLYMFKPEDKPGGALTVGKVYEVMGVGRGDGDCLVFVRVEDVAEVDARPSAAMVHMVMGSDLARFRFIGARVAPESTVSKSSDIEAGKAMLGELGATAATSSTPNPLAAPIAYDDAAPAPKPPRARPGSVWKHLTRGGCYLFDGSATVKVVAPDDHLVVEGEISVGKVWYPDPTVWEPQGFLVEDPVPRGIGFFVPDEVTAVDHFTVERGALIMSAVAKEPRELFKVAINGAISVEDAILVEALNQHGTPLPKTGLPLRWEKAPNGLSATGRVYPVWLKPKAEAPGRYDGEFGSTERGPIRPPDNSLWWKRGWQGLGKHPVAGLFRLTHLTNEAAALSSLAGPHEIVAIPMPWTPGDEWTAYTGEGYDPRCALGLFVPDRITSSGAIIQSGTTLAGAVHGCDFEVVAGGRYVPSTAGSTDILVRAIRPKVAIQEGETLQFYTPPAGVSAEGKLLPLPKMVTDAETPKRTVVADAFLEAPAQVDQLRALYARELHSFYGKPAIDCTEAEVAQYVAGLQRKEAPAALPKEDRRPPGTVINKPIAFLDEHGLLFELNRKVLHPRGLMLVQQAGKMALVDGRADPEGFSFDEVSLSEGAQKLAAHPVSYDTRRARFGYVVQPVAGEGTRPELTLTSADIAERFGPNEDVRLARAVSGSAVLDDHGRERLRVVGVEAHILVLGPGAGLLHRFDLGENDLAFLRGLILDAAVALLGFRFGLTAPGRAEEILASVTARKAAYLVGITAAA